MDKQKIIAKIKKCLSLSASSNEHEAANALRQAHALMKQYAISQSDIQLSDVRESRSKLRQRTNVPKHLSLLAGVIANTMGCRNFLSVDHWSPGAMVFVGVSPNDELAAYAFDTLSRKLNKARKQFQDEELRYVRLRSNKIRRSDIYCLGWVVAIINSVENLKVHVPELVGKYMQENHPGLEPYKPRSTKFGSGKKNESDFNSGHSDGSQVDLSRPISGSEQCKTLGSIQ
jgi:hypothetical protein